MCEEVTTTTLPVTANRRGHVSHINASHNSILLVILLLILRLLVGVTAIDS